jgi:hypothetical protein
MESALNFVGGILTHPVYELNFWKLSVKSESSIIALLATQLVNSLRGPNRVVQVTNKNFYNILTLLYW